MTRERLQKVMAACGVGSRRACELIIAEGRVEVDGEVVTKPGSLVDPAVNEIVCDGSKLRTKPYVYMLLNKPRGVICSNRSDADKPAAIDYAPRRYADQHLYTVGRLDVDSEGAIILTNDGDLCHLATHPRFEIEKTYRVEVEDTPDEATLVKMRKGIWLSEGRTAAIGVRLVKRHGNRATLEVRLKEGKKREVRRLCARFGHKVRRLVRVAIGPIELGRLATGKVRPLEPDEVEALRKSANAVIRLGAPRPAPRAKRGGQRS